VCLDEDLKEGPYPILQLQSGQFKIAEDSRDAIDLEKLKQAVKSCQPWKPSGKITGDIALKKAAIDFHNKKFQQFKDARAKGDFKKEVWFEFIVEVKPRCTPAEITALIETLGENKPVSHKTLQSKVMLYYEDKAKATAATKSLQVSRPKTALLQETKGTGVRKPVPI